ncbi:MAG: hypothetical protein ACK4P1_10100, partial [Aggregatilineales bacterium]
MKGKTLRLLLIGLALGFLAFVSVALLSDLSALLGYATAFAWWLMLPILALRMANWALRFAKWHFYLGVVGVRNISLKASAAVFLMGFPLAI